MTSRHVMHTTVRRGRVVKTNPAREVSHRLCSGPIGIILVPCDDTAVMSRFVKDLVVPKTYGTREQLRRGNEECGIPHAVVQTWLQSPCAECMKENRVWVR